MQQGLPVFEVEYIIAQRTRKKKKRFKVHWKDQTTEEESWEPLAHLRTSAPRALLEFYEKKGYPACPSIYSKRKEQQPKKRRKQEAESWRREREKISTLRRKKKEQHQEVGRN